MSFFFPNQCSMCDWISVSDHMMMLFRSFVYIYLIIIVLYVVIMVWGSITCFPGLLEREEQGEDWRESLDQPLVYQLWIFLISETCCYMLAEHCASLFQPQYVDGLLNPSHRILSFTTELATQLGKACLFGVSLDFFQLHCFKSFLGLRNTFPVWLHTSPAFFG